MKIVVIHEVNYLTKVIYEYQIIPEILASLGHEVVVIDYDETWRDANGLTGPIWDLKTRVHKGVSRAYPEGQVTVRRPGMIRLPVLSRLTGAALNGAEVFRELRRSHVDAILLYGVPTVGVQTLLAAYFHGVPVIFRAIDISHELVARLPIVSRVTRFLEGVVYKRADGVIALTPRFKSYIQSYGVPESKVRVLPVGVDCRMFCDGSISRTGVHHWGITDDDFVALFMGTIYRFSGLDRVIQDLPQLIAAHPTTKLLIVGHGEDEPRLRELSHTMGVAHNVVFTGVQPYALLPEIIRAANVCINPFELNAITRDILPTKVFQYLATGRPVLATQLPGMLPFLAGEQHGVVYASPEDFIAQLGALEDDHDRCVSLGKAGAETMRSSYDWLRIAEKLLAYMAEFN